MRSIEALSNTSNVVDWLMSSRRPRILHVFDHACNLINERMEVLSIVTSKIGNGPFNLVLKDDVIFNCQIDSQSAISISGARITIGALAIHTNTAILWSARPDWDALHTRRGRILNLVRSISRTVPEPILPKNLTSSLSMALARNDIPSALTLTPSLAGLGMGLTPAGDDFIVGTIYATWILHPFETAYLICQKITDNAAPLTTSLSRAWLRSAGRGEAGILWHDLFQALANGDVPAIQSSIAALLSIGQTSGADALSGFISLFVYWSKMRGEQNVNFNALATGT